MTSNMTNRLSFEELEKVSGGGWFDDVVDWVEDTVEDTVDDYIPPGVKNIVKNIT